MKATLITLTTVPAWSLELGDRIVRIDEHGGSRTAPVRDLRINRRYEAIEVRCGTATLLFPPMADVDVERMSFVEGEEVWGWRRPPLPPSP